MNKTKQNRHGFTLIELLVVIVIITILVSLLFPAIKTALLKAEAAKAKTTVLNIATAFKAFNAEYGRWPTGATSSSQDLNTNLFNSANGNTRNIVFLDTASKDINSSGYILDPWKTPYHITFDVNYQNSVSTNCSSGGGTIAGGVAIWSSGPDGTCGTSDDVTSW